MRESKGTRESRETASALLKSPSLAFIGEVRWNELGGKEGLG